MNIVPVGVTQLVQFAINSVVPALLLLCLVLPFAEAMATLRRSAGDCPAVQAGRLAYSSSEPRLGYLVRQTKGACSVHVGNVD